MSNDNKENPSDKQKAIFDAPSVFSQFLPTEQEELEAKEKMRVDFEFCTQNHKQEWVKVQGNQWLCFECNKVYTQDRDRNWGIGTIPPSIRDKVLR